MVVVVGLAAAVIATQPASAGPNEDYAAVHADWQADGDVGSCRFTRPQLVNAHNLATNDDLYNGFRDEVDREINRWDSGGCNGAGGGSSNKADFHIVALKGKVRSRNKRKEYVTIKNKGGKTGSLKGWAVKDRSGHRIRFRRKLRVKAHRRLRVVTGCVKGHRKAFRRGSRYYACRKKSIWNDKGDVAKLARPGGNVVSQRGFGRFKRVSRF